MQKAKLFCNSDQAGAILGLSARQFRRAYVETGKLKAHNFKASRQTFAGASARTMYLTADVEKLKLECRS